MKNLQTYEDFINEATSTDSNYIFFYAASDTLINIDTDRIFKGWKEKFVDENLSREWIAFVKPIKNIDKAESTIESTIKKFPRFNNITYQSGTYINGNFKLVKGSYVVYGMESIYIKTLLDLMGK